MFMHGPYSIQINWNVWKWELDIGVKILGGFIAAKFRSHCPRVWGSVSTRYGPSLMRLKAKCFTWNGLNEGCDSGKQESLHFLCHPAKSLPGGHLEKDPAQQGFQPGLRQAEKKEAVHYWVQKLRAEQLSGYQGSCAKKTMQSLSWVSKDTSASDTRLSRCQEVELPPPLLLLSKKSAHIGKGL